MDKKKKFFKLMDDYIIIHSKGELKSNKILIPQTNSYEQRRQWADNDNRVYNVAENIQCLKKGDKVLLVPHAKLRKIDEITKIMEGKLGIKLTVDVKSKDGKTTLAQEDKEKYFIVNIEDIICVVND